MGKRIESIIDTNVILRFLVGDVPHQQEEARKIFSEAQKGTFKIHIKPLIIAEACFVLESFYKKSRDDISDAFEVFLAQKWLIVEDRNAMLSLWSHYRRGFHFVDSYILAWCTVKNAQLLTFDKDLLRENT